MDWDPETGYPLLKGAYMLMLTSEPSVNVFGSLGNVVDLTVEVELELDSRDGVMLSGDILAASNRPVWTGAETF